LNPQLFFSSVSVGRLLLCSWNSILEYTYLHPPLINFNSSVQKSFKNKNDMTTSILNYSSEFILKRNKPLKSSRYSLENMMGLRLKKKKGKNK